MSQIWSDTDLPYKCLKDEARTLAFRTAIRSVVRCGDVVVVAEIIETSLVEEQQVPVLNACAVVA